MKQIELANQLGISKSYLSMLISGKREPTPELAKKLQTASGVHKLVNNDTWNMLYTQEVTGSSPVPPTIEVRKKPRIGKDPIENFEDPIFSI